MFPAALRRRLDRLNNLQSSLLALHQDQLDQTPPEVDLGSYTPKGFFSSTNPSRPTSASSKGSTVSVSADASGTSTPEVERSALSTYEVSSGLRWNRVAPAFSLLRNAGFEAQQPNADPQLVRNLYIDGLGYLLEALPSDLTEEEALSIHGRLPEPVKVSVEKSTGATSQRNLCTSSPPSYLHRLIATFIVYIFVLVQVMLPYVRTALNSVYTYERKHRITERILAAALKTADGVGKGTQRLTLQEGMITTTVSRLLFWLAESVAGGVYDGVSEGLVVLGGAHWPVSAQID